MKIDENRRKSKKISCASATRGDRAASITMLFPLIGSDYTRKLPAPASLSQTPENSDDQQELKSRCSSLSSFTTTLFSFSLHP